MQSLTTNCLSLFCVHSRVHVGSRCADGAPADAGPPMPELHHTKPPPPVHALTITMHCLIAALLLPPFSLADGAPADAGPPMPELHHNMGLLVSMRCLTPNPTHRTCLAAFCAAPPPPLPRAVSTWQANAGPHLPALNHNTVGHTIEPTPSVLLPSFAPADGAPADAGPPMPELHHNMGLLVSMTEAQLRRMDAQLQHQQVCACVCVWGGGGVQVILGRVRLLLTYTSA